MHKKEKIIRLDKAQHEAVTHVDGPALVIAGPGSGKTTVIVHRIIHLIEQGIAPESIMVVTFSTTAAEEMKIRYKSLAAQYHLPGRERVTFGTFHSIFFKILKYGGGYTGKNILRESEKYRCIRTIINNNDNTENIISEISAARNSTAPLEQYIPKACSRELFLSIINAYNNYKKQYDKIDFDDMIILCNKMLHENNNLLEKLQSIFKYILIDEFQDINRMQYETIKMLAQPQNNIFAVGDDDQSIYRFRGADPAIMFDFLEEYTYAKRINLDINYRSHPEIVKASQSLISHNKKRFDKNIRPHVDAHIKKGADSYKSTGDNIVDTRVFKDYKMQAEAVVKKIQYYALLGIKYEEMAILLRNNMQQENITGILAENNIAFNIKNRRRSVYDTDAGRHIVSLIETAVKYQGASDVAAVKMLSKLPTMAAINFIRYTLSDNINIDNNIYETILETAEQYPEKKQWLQYVYNYQMQTLKNGGDFREAVNVMTMHASKGMEYKIVFILSANQGIIPGERMITTDEAEEERRVFYVALTRASERIHIFSVEEIHGKKMDISCYVKEVKAG